jgi:hypothetical protein
MCLNVPWRFVFVYHTTICVTDQYMQANSRTIQFIHVQRPASRPQPYVRRSRY